MPFNPQYTITPEIALALTRIETSRCAVEYLPVSVGLLHGLRQSARLKSTHYSTRIEGNPLSQEAVEQAVVAGKVGQGWQQDEVLFYYRAQDLVETLAQAATPLKESDIQRLHGIAYHGRQRGTPYRTEQNVIRHAGGGIVYLPPEPQDVPIMIEVVVGLIKQKKQGTVHPQPLPLFSPSVHDKVPTNKTYN
jgi:Fic family protein